MHPPPLTPRAGRERRRRTRGPGWPGRRRRSTCRPGKLWRQKERSKASTPSTSSAVASSSFEFYLALLGGLTAPPPRSLGPRSSLLLSLGRSISESAGRQAFVRGAFLSSVFRSSAGRVFSSFFLCFAACSTVKKCPKKKRAKSWRRLLARKPPVLARHPRRLRLVPSPPCEASGIGSWTSVE